MEESKKPTPEQYGWINLNSSDDNQGKWTSEAGAEKYYKALNQYNKEKVKELFDKNGMCLQKKELYFDSSGDLNDVFLISKDYKKYPANSDIVRMYYADIYAEETHGNYKAKTLFFRAF